MMKKIRDGVLISFLLFGAASSAAFAQGTSCTYELNKESVTVGWTAFKTTQKTAVSGSFKKVVITGPTQAQSLPLLMEGLTVSVDDLSSDSGNPARDQNLADFFFKKLKPTITGKIGKFSEKTQSFVLVLNLNGKIKDVPMSYAAGRDQSFVATGRTSIVAFGGAKALNALHQQCLVLHKGPDGVSKTWPDVVVSLKGTINKSCK